MIKYDILKEELLNKVILDPCLCQEVVLEVLMSDGPALSLNRIGGSDTNAVVDYYINVVGGNKSFDLHFQQHYLNCCKLNGFFASTEADARDQYVLYLNVLHKIYCKSKFLFVCNWQWIYLFFRSELTNTPYHDVPSETLNSYRKYADQIGMEGKYIASYSYFENIASTSNTFLWALHKAMQGKTVTILSSHASSMKKRVDVLDNLFPGFTYDDISFNFIKTPVTYLGMPKSLFPAKSWLDVLRKIERSIHGTISGSDLLLLSCGSYALPLTYLTAKKYNLKSVYVGGIVQLYFGILGGRWSNQKYSQKLNHRYFSLPVSEDDYRDTVDQSQEPASAYF